MRNAVAILVALLLTSIAATAGEQTLYSFTGANDGANPFGGLAMDAAGNLYGTTTFGGTTQNGVVFELIRNQGWKEVVLYNFTGNADGGNPTSKLLFDQAGNLYGTTQNGGDSAGCGVVFELSPSTDGWKEKVLWTFNQADGEAPYGDLILDGDGNLYGTTVEGGGAGNCINGGCGTAFELSPKPNGNWKLTVLHRFTGGNDGATPLAGLVLDAAGNLYGTAWNGGPNATGIVFALSRSGAKWNERVLLAFDRNGDNGAYPEGPLVFDGQGNLYGTSSAGGYYSEGTIFKIDPKTGVATTIYTFTGRADQGAPACGLEFDQEGNLYGTTTGGLEQYGTVFKLSPGVWWTETTLYSFMSAADGDTPETGVIVEPDGVAYGVSSGLQGQGSYAFGAVYQINLTSSF